MKKTIVVLGVFALFEQSQAWAASPPAAFDVQGGQTQTAGQTLGNSLTGTVEAGGALDVSGGTTAIAVTGNATIVNNGTIDADTGRAIRDNTGGLTLTVTNNAGATIFTNDSDVIQMNKSDSNIVFNNYGTLNSNNASAGGSQAIDFNAITTGSNVLHNFASGQILATEADAVRPGVNGFVFNDGVIKSTNNAATLGDSSDGVDLQANSGVTVVNATTGTATQAGTGSIIGARHGITGGAATATDTFTLNVTNNLGGLIQGNDGSGINIDGFNANEVVTIVNHGTIIGNGIDGDGDGVDVDGLVNLTNTGTIVSTRAFNDASEGVTVGGGTIVNSGRIEGDNVNGGIGRGITLAGLDKDPDTGDAIPTEGIFANTTVVNSGLIRGQTDSAIAVTGARNNFTVTIENLVGGVLEGGGPTAAAVFTGANDATVIDYGAIIADQSGKAVDLGSGNSSLQILGGSASIQGDISGGAGTSSLTIAPGAGQAFAYDGAISNFATVEIGAGNVTLNGVSSYTGTTTIDAGGTLAVGDAAHRGATIGSGLTEVSAGATLGGYGTALGSVNNAGRIVVAAALPGFAGMGPGTFTIDGNYTGTNGLLLMNEQVNAGGIASHLVIGGNAGGTTNVHVAVTRNGVQTNGDGIELVQVNGTSAANSFRLSAPVQSGAYQYLLYKGGAAGANNWYLRTTLEDGDTAANAAATAQAQGVATDFAEAAPGGAAASNAPVAYRPGVVGYSMTPLLNADYGFTLLGQLQDRVGDIANVENRTPVNQNQRNGIWARIGGDNVDANSSGRFSADERTFFAQFGKDWTLARGAQGGSTHAGVTVSFGSSSATFEDSARSINPSLTNNTGSVETQAQSIGGYWTKYLADGTYFDGVGQFTHYRNKYGDVFGDGATQNGFGAGASGEVGKPFAIGSTPIAIEPQAQLLYQYLHLNGFSDSVSDVSSNTTNALRGRIGFRVFDANLSNDAKTGSATPYFSANILHDFLSPGTTTVGATPFDDHLSKTWYELGLGVSATMGNASMLYANVSYAHNIGGEYRRQIFGQVGYRYSW